MEFPYCQQGCLELGTSHRARGSPEWKAGGLGQRHGSEAPCFVTLAKAYPSLSFSFLPGKMRHWAHFTLFLPVPLTEGGEAPLNPMPFMALTSRPTLSSQFWVHWKIPLHPAGTLAMRLGLPRPQLSSSIFPLVRQWPHTVWGP